MGSDEELCRRCEMGIATAVSVILGAEGSGCDCFVIGAEVA